MEAPSWKFLAEVGPRLQELLKERTQRYSSILLTREFPQWMCLPGTSDVLCAAISSVNWSPQYEAYLVWFICGRSFISAVKITTAELAELERHPEGVYKRRLEQAVEEAHGLLIELVEKTLVPRDQATTEGGVGAIYCAEVGLLPRPKQDLHMWLHKKDSKGRCVKCLEIAETCSGGHPVDPVKLEELRAKHQKVK